MNLHRWFLPVIAATLVAMTANANAAMISLGASNDTWIRADRSYLTNGVAEVLDNFGAFVPYVQFDMSGLDIDTVSSATLRVTKVQGIRNDSWTADRNATYGLTDIADNTLQYWDETDDFDPMDATSGLDFRNVGLEWTNDAANFGVDVSRLTSLNPEDGANVTEAFDGTTSVISLTGPDLVSFLNTRADANGLVTFLLPVLSSNRSWGIASKENADSALHPQLDLEYSTNIPEPTSVVLCGLLGLGAFIARRYR